MTAATADHYEVAPARPGSRWEARLSLLVRGGERGSRLVGASHDGPLYVQKPFYPEGPACPHLYLLHPPGGVVSGDTLSIDLSLEDAASLLITTPGSNRLYRARRDGPDGVTLPQRVHARLALGPGCTLEWFPMETIVFDGASIDLRTEVELRDDAVFVGWEIVCLGLPARGETFRDGRIMQAFSISRGGRPLLLDRLSLEAGSPLLAARCGLAGLPVCGTFVIGPVAADGGAPGIDRLVDALRREIERQRWRDKVAVTTVRDLIVVRYLGEYADEARDAFVALWAHSRPAVLGRAAVRPRIWAT